MKRIVKNIVLTATCLFMQPVTAKTNVKPYFDIEIPKEDVSVSDFIKIMDGLSFMSIEGPTNPTISLLLENMDISFDPEKTVGQVITAVVESRDEVGEMLCNTERCTATFTGRKVRMKLDGVSLPGLGQADLIIENTVQIDYIIPQDSGRLELCKLQGLKLKAGFLTQNIDGLLIELDGDSVAKAFLDVGTGGSYPKSC